MMAKQLNLKLAKAKKDLVQIKLFLSRLLHNKQRQSDGFTATAFGLCQQLKRCIDTVIFKEIVTTKKNSYCLRINIMKVLVVGASGATGRLVVDRLLSQDVEVSAIVRRLDALPDNANLNKIQASVHNLSITDMATHLEGCSAVVSCLGHNLTFKGMFGKPRLLVTDTLQCICRAIKSINSPNAVKVILMNTTGNSNRDIPETPPLSQRIVISILRALLPPHVDNENAADFLRTQVGQNDDAIEWVAIRPDALTDETQVTAYNVCTSPIRNAIFDSGVTSRINVGYFMTELVLNKSLWLRWKGHMPVIYNCTQ
jgi:hypothetical protein